MRNVFTSIDVGSNSIKIVVCQLFNNKLNLLAASSVKSEGIRNGMIVNSELATTSIKKAISEVEEMLGIEIKKVITSVPCENADYTLAKGKVVVSDEEVVGTDITSVLENSLKSIDTDNEVVNLIPIDFDLDNQKGLIDPKGKTGHNLSSRSIVSLVPKKNVYSVANLLENLGIEVVDISLNPIGDINALRNKNTENKVGAIVNIGYETTTISLYNKNIVIKSSVINYGSKNIDDDISYIYKINTKEAVKIKEKFALAHKRYASKSEYFETINKLSEKIRINQFEVSEIVMSRIEEILMLARKEINILTKREVDYIIITGGTSSMDSFKVVVEEILGSTAQVGSVKVLGIRNNKYSSALGNIVYFINKLRLRGIQYTMVDDYEYEEDNKIMNVINDTMLGKVFGYFFE